MKLCTKCNESKPLSEFSQSKKEKDYVQYRCKACNKHYRSLRKEHVRGLHLKRRFDLSLETYQRMLDEQSGVCKICGNPEQNKQLAVDHCHTTGKIRGLLCGGCNRGLGYFRDNKSLLKQAIKYLEERN